MFVSMSAKHIHPERQPLFTHSLKASSESPKLSVGRDTISVLEMRWWRTLVDLTVYRLISMCLMTNTVEWATLEGISCRLDNLFEVIMGHKTPPVLIFPEVGKASFVYWLTQIDGISNQIEICGCVWGHFQGGLSEMGRPTMIMGSIHFLHWGPRQRKKRKRGSRSLHLFASYLRMQCEQLPCPPAAVTSCREGLSNYRPP